MKKTITTLALTGLLCIQCSTDTTFKITDTAVGKLTKTTTLEELATLYVNDSIVGDTEALAEGKMNGNVAIYEKGGALLLTLSASDAESKTIKNIRVHDARFTTSDGVNTLSSFKDIREQYTIDKIVNSLNNVVVFVKDSGAYFTISKEELPAELRYNTSIEIEAVQIPDAAAIKYMMISWE